MARDATVASESDSIATQPLTRRRTLQLTGAAGLALGAASSASAQEAPDPTVTFTDTASDGSGVVVDSATLPQGGFVAIHSSEYLIGETTGSVMGTSAYLSTGSHTDIPVEWDVDWSEDETLYAVIYQDSNFNETFDFVSSGGVDDNTYTDSSDTAIQDDAIVTYDTSADPVGGAEENVVEDTTADIAVTQTADGVQLELVADSPDSQTIDVSVIGPTGTDGSVPSYDGEGSHLTDMNGYVDLPAPSETVELELTASNFSVTKSVTLSPQATESEEDAPTILERLFGRTDDTDGDTVSSSDSDADSNGRGFWNRLFGRSSTSDSDSTETRGNGIFSRLFGSSDSDSNGNGIFSRLFGR